MALTINEIDPDRNSGRWDRAACPEHGEIRGFYEPEDLHPELATKEQ